MIITLSDAKSDNPVYFNAHNVCAVCRDIITPYTRVYFGSHSLVVSEPIGHVVELLKSALNTPTRVVSYVR